MIGMCIRVRSSGASGRHPACSTGGMAKLVAGLLVFAAACATEIPEEDAPLSPAGGKADGLECPVAVEDPAGYDGIVGTFDRSTAPEGELGSIVFETLEEGDAHIAVEGDYEVVRAGASEPARGRYQALPQNPAIGAVLC